MLDTHALETKEGYPASTSRVPSSGRGGHGNLQATDSKDPSQSNLLGPRHLQAPNDAYGQHQDHKVGDDIADGSRDEDGTYVDAVWASNLKCLPDGCTLEDKYQDKDDAPAHLENANQDEYERQSRSGEKSVQCE